MGDYQNRRHLIKNDQILWNLTQGAIHLSVWSLNCLPLFNFSQVKHLIAEGDLLVQEWSYVIKKGSKIWRMHYLHKCLQLLSMLTPINIAIRMGKDYRYCIDKVLFIRTWQLAPTSHIFTMIIIRQKVSLLNDKEENALLMESTCAGFDFESWSALTSYSFSLFWFSKWICVDILFLAMRVTRKWLEDFKSLLKGSRILQRWNRLDASGCWQSDNFKQCCILLDWDPSLSLIPNSFSFL